METDKTTLHDLSLFHGNEELSVFDKLNFTKTVGGREVMKKMFLHSLPNSAAILETQNILRLIISKLDKWPENVGNGTLLMIHKFYEAVIEIPPRNAYGLSGKLYPYFHRHDFSLLKYSVGHAFDFLKGLQSIVHICSDEEIPIKLKTLLDRASTIMELPQLQIIFHKNNKAELSPAENLKLGRFIRFHFKQNLFQLMDIFSQLDAWFGMSKAIVNFDLKFPVFKESEKPVLNVQKLYHVLLPNPVSYDLQLNEENNFLFLTGANMAGKSTLIKSLGNAVYLAHLGMGVPAQSMELSYFDGLLSNINVTDNILKGESFFYNEVQRIKNTISKISDGRKWLILIDELFKGTNVQDAMRCSTVVIEGLVKVKHSLFILSTHLYEISEDLKHYPNISFKYFETNVENDKLHFSYQLKEGISNDRLGYLILKKENVIDLLEKL